MKTLIYGNLLSFLLLLGSCRLGGTPPNANDDPTYTISLDQADLCGDPTLTVNFKVTSSDPENYPVPSEVTLDSIRDTEGEGFSVLENASITLNNGVGNAANLAASSGTDTIQADDVIKIKVKISGTVYTSTTKTVVDTGKCKGGNKDKAAESK